MSEVWIRGRYLPVLGLFGVLLLLVMISQYRHFAVEQQLLGCNVLWSDDEAFIILDIRTLGWERNAPQLLRDIGRALLRVPPDLPDRSRNDVILYHLTTQAMRRYTIDDFTVQGGAFPFEDQIYCSFRASGESIQHLPGLYRWNGSTFEPIPPDETNTIRSSFIFFSDTFKHEGWHQDSDFVPGRLEERTVTMRIADNEMIITQMPANPRVVKLFNGENANEEKLIELDESIRKVSEEEYLRIMDSAPRTGSRPRIELSPKSWTGR